MNFLKITGLVIGTGSVVGGTGAGVYYGMIKNNESDTTAEGTNKAAVIEPEIVKTQFDGKLVFVKQSDNNYQIEFLTDEQYTTKANAFDANKTDDTQKYEAVNKVVPISLQLNLQEATKQLNAILGETLTLEAIKAKITDKETDLKALFSESIYTNLKNKVNS